MPVVKLGQLRRSLFARIHRIYRIQQKLFPPVSICVKDPCYRGRTVRRFKHLIKRSPCRHKASIAKCRYSDIALIVRIMLGQCDGRKPVIVDHPVAEQYVSV